jgi:membrane protease YdiL (CAAX protease family)
MTDATLARAAGSEPARRWPILVCLGLIALFPLVSVPVQGATGALALRVGEIPARALTEGAIWSYAAVVLAIALFGEPRTLASIGLRRPTFGTILWGFGAFAALLALGACASFVTYNIFHQPNHAVAEVEALVRGSLVYALCLALRAGVIEELFYRGLAIEQLTVLTGRRWFAALLATLVFIAIHMLRFDARQLIPIATTSFGLAGLYLWRRNLWVNMIAHVLIDTVALGAVALKATSLY